MKKEQSRIILPNAPLARREGLIDVGEHLAKLDQAKEDETNESKESIISQRVAVPLAKIDAAVAFWKPIYFSATIDGRHLNGVEAYNLGDPAKSDHPDQGPCIALMNLMALEALRIMGDEWPTVEDPQTMVFGIEREQKIADFWKQTFAPTLFQAQWAWAAALAVMAGAPGATAEILDNYADQLP